MERTVRTDNAGFSSFPDLPVGNYDHVVRQAGFKEFRQTSFEVNANSAIRADVRLEVGATKQTVTISSTAVRVETNSTQMGEVITGSAVTAIPLNGRSYTDLLALQPGVVPVSSGEYDAGFSPSGTLNAQRGEAFHPH